MPCRGLSANDGYGVVVRWSVTGRNAPDGASGHGIEYARFSHGADHQVIGAVSPQKGTKRIADSALANDRQGSEAVRGARCDTGALCAGGEGSRQGWQRLLFACSGGSWAWPLVQQSHMPAFHTLVGRGRH